MTDYTQEAYECSIQTSAIRIDNTEWINEFSQGIQLKKGDQVRLLGSFIQEGSDSNEIEVEEDQEINISYSPYLLGNTIDTIDKTENGNLIDLSQIGDLAYSTDSFGIEPPMRNTSQKGNSTDTWNQLSPDTQPYQYPTTDGSVAATAGPPAIAAYENMPTTNPAATGESGGDVYGDITFNPWFINGVTEPMGTPVYTGGPTVLTDRPNMIGDKAITYGTNIRTGDFQKKNTNQNYDAFADNEIPTEMYIGNMVKKFILPQIDNFETANTNVNPQGNLASDNNGANWAANCISHQLEPILENHAAAGQAGMLGGVPKVGMCIATVDIGESSGWSNDEGECFYENTWGDSTAVGAVQPNFVEGSNLYNPPIVNGSGGPATLNMAGASGYSGIPNLKSGVQSVIGTIVAVRPTKMHIMGKTTKVYEVYATNFINPAQLAERAEITHTFTDKRQLTRASTFFTEGAGQMTCRKKIHGASLLRNGYNFNPSFNNVNGADNHATTGSLAGRLQVGNNSNLHGNQAGANSGTPTRNTYLNNAPTASTVPAVPANLRLQSGPQNVASVNTGAGRTEANEVEMGLGNPEGLSFLWNGSHTGNMKISNLTSNVNRYRANSWLELKRTGNAGDQNALRVRHYINDIILQNKVDGTVNPATDAYFDRAKFDLPQGSVPTALGAYIICPKETMIRIARGEFDATPANNFFATAGRTPRIWLDYAYQARMSNYTTRHYVGNSWDTINGGSNVSNNPNTRFPQSSTYVNEHRWGYNMIGRPPNINWRQSVANNGNADLELANVMNHNFQGAGYNVDWDVFPGSGSLGPNGVGLPNILSSQNGGFDGITNVHTFRNLPFVFCGYNTCINSIYFQQKDTGDCNLGLDSWRGQTDVTALQAAGTTTLTISNNIADINDPNLARVLPVLNDGFGRYSVKVLLDNCQFNPVELIGQVVDNGNNTSTITFLNQPHNNPVWLTDIPFGTIVIISYLSNGGRGIGTDSETWASDLIMIKENIMKMKVERGFYTEEQLAEKINDTFHYSKIKYQKELGVKDPNSNNYNIPSNVGLTDNALSSEPSLIKGNFVQSYLPDINYGFSPITTTNSVALDRPAQTQELTNVLLTYESIRIPGPAVEFEHYWPEQINILRPYNGTTTRYLTDNTAQYPTELGTHFKMYSIPYISKTYQDTKEISLIRLRGGGLTLEDFDATNGRWDNVKPKMPGVMENLRTYSIVPYDPTDPNSFPQDNALFMSTSLIYAYRSRLTRNLFASGGSARIFVGANNFTFSWEQGANRYSFNNLYTPIRPHQIENPPNNPQNDFGIGDAVPSGIISAKHSGKDIAQLTGIYINRLNAGAFTTAEWGATPLGDFRLYDTVSNTVQRQAGQELLTILGFTSAQVDSFDNSFDLGNDLFIYESDTIQSGSAIRVGAKITPAVNGSNPTASRCLNVAPVQQFFVQLDTDDFYARNVPSKGNDPYYKIGSDFPCKTFFGNQNGAKIPIIGLCSRNFSAFNFVFDLGGSAINYIITEDTTISSIRTKIYTSNLRSPVNLAENSAIIYLITRYGVNKDLTPQQGLEFAQQFQAQANAPLVNDFYSQPTNMVRTIPPINPSKFYYSGFGEVEPPIDTDSSDED